MAKINEYLNKKIPLMNKSVKDYFASGDSNAMVAGAKNSIDKISSQIE